MLRFISESSFIPLIYVSILLSIINLCHDYCSLQMSFEVRKCEPFNSDLFQYVMFWHQKHILSTKSKL